MTPISNNKPRRFFPYNIPALCIARVCSEADAWSIQRSTYKTMVKTLHDDLISLMRRCARQKRKFVLVSVYFFSNLYSLNCLGVVMKKTGVCIGLGFHQCLLQSVPVYPICLAGWIPVWPGCFNGCIDETLLIEHTNQMPLRCKWMYARINSCQLRSPHWWQRLFLFSSRGQWKKGKVGEASCMKCTQAVDDPMCRVSEILSVNLSVSLSTIVFSRA